MKRFKIVHRTYYNFSGLVSLDPHYLRLRPRESHELRIESYNLKITPSAKLRWFRDVESNSVAIANFSTPTEQLAIESEVVIQHFDEAPFDFLVADYAQDYPFNYLSDDRQLLMPYIASDYSNQLAEWVGAFWQAGDRVQSFELLLRLCTEIQKYLNYTRREEPGVQSAEQTLGKLSGSCRDYATLFIHAARHLGLAARFVSGYLQASPSSTDFGATHAWAEVFIPGAGWKGFDPTMGCLVGTGHIAIAVSRLPESVPPISGSFTGPPGSSLDVGVWVTELN